MSRVNSKLILTFQSSTRDTCEECKRLEATWEAVGLELKDRLNVGRVDKGGEGGVTARRFDVIETPAFLL